MKNPEEDLVIDLYDTLTREFSSKPTAISRDGAEVCTVARDDSKCVISCFHSHAEYYTEFIRASIEIATSRIPSKDDTIAAVRDWLDGQDLQVLYARYSFVDREKRALTRVRDDAITNAPELRTASPRLNNEWGNVYKLQFGAADRSCQVSFYGRDALPNARFSWDDCQLFQFQPDDNARLAAVLKRWICDGAKPSEMRYDFPWIDIGDLADYYERGAPIEGEFIHSWERIEKFYRLYCWCEFLESVLSMIHSMRAAGYHHLLRARQSHWSLVLSRSRRHGRRRGQPHIRFQFRNSVMDVRADFASIDLKDHPIQFTKEVQQLLDFLADCDID
jgi:hypothetical protein